MSARTFGDLAYIGTAVALMLLSVGFLAFTKWWATALGQTIGAFLFAIFAIMFWTFLILTGIVSRDASWLYDLRAVLFGALCLSSWGMFIGFIRAQFFVRKKKSNDHTNIWEGHR